LADNLSQIKVLGIMERAWRSALQPVCSRNEFQMLHHGGRGYLVNAEQRSHGLMRQKQNLMALYRFKVIQERA
jgi:hypothetical protein